MSEEKKEQKKNKIVEAFDVIVDATATYLRKIFPQIFDLTHKE